MKDVARRNMEYLGLNELEYHRYVGLMGDVMQDWPPALLGRVYLASTKLGLCSEVVSAEVVAYVKKEPTQ